MGGNYVASPLHVCYSPIRRLLLGLPAYHAKCPQPSWNIVRVVSALTQGRWIFGIRGIGGQTLWPFRVKVDPGLAEDWGPWKKRKSNASGGRSFAEPTHVFWYEECSAIQQSPVCALCKHHKYVGRLSEFAPVNACSGPQPV